jgi:hypothetical protein
MDRDNNIGEVVFNSSLRYSVGEPCSVVLTLKLIGNTQISASEGFILESTAESKITSYHTGNDMLRV